MACGFRSAGNWCCLKITPQNEALTKAKLPFPQSVINESCTRAVSPSLYLDTAWSYQRIKRHVSIMLTAPFFSSSNRLHAHTIIKVRPFQASGQ